MSTELLKPARKHSLWAIASLVCGVVGLFTGVVAIPAVVFGHIAKKELSGNTELSGVGMAIAGLILGYIGISLGAIGFLVFGGLGGLFLRLLFLS